MNTIGHVADGHFFAALAGPHMIPHASGNLAMKLAHTIGVVGQTEAKNGHREFSKLLTRSASPFNDPIDRNPRFRLERAQMGFDQADRKCLVPRRHRSMRGEHIRSRHHFGCSFQIQPFGLHQELHAGDAQERGMAFIQVTDIGFDAHSQQGTETTEREQQLLTQTVGLTAAVEPCGDLTELRWILRHVRIQQHKGHTAHHELPDSGMKRSFRQRDGDLESLALRRAGSAHGQAADFIVRIALLLPAFFIKPLLKEALMIKQADGCERNSKVRCRLQMIAREQSQATGVKPDRFMQSELQREIGDLAVDGFRARGRSRELGFHLAELLLERIVFRKCRNGGLRKTAEEFQSVTSDFAPERCVDTAEEGDRVLVPAPPDVAGKRFQETDGIGDVGRDVNDLDVGHDDAGVRLGVNLIQQVMCLFGRIVGRNLQL